MLRRNKPLLLFTTFMFVLVFLIPGLIMPRTASAANPAVTALDASAFDEDSAILNARLISDGDYDVVEYGFYYDNSSTVTTSDDKEVAGTGDLEYNDTFNATIGSLESETRYYFRAYIIYEDGGGHNHTVLSGNTRFFTTDESADNGDRPDVSTDIASRISYSSATLNGEIESEGASNILEYGFYYGTSSSTSNKKKVGSSIDEGDDFDYRLTGLRDDTRYYFKAYARNAEGIAYGSLRSFWTEEESKVREDRPTVRTKEPSTGGGYVTFYGVVTSEGDSNIDSYGFYYGTSSSPNNRIRVGGSIDEDETFSYSLTGLNPGTYYVRAYATNNAGTGYGSVYSFQVSSRIASSVFTIGSPYYNVRGVFQTGEAAPYIKNNRTYLPIKPVGYAVGLSDANIVWNPVYQSVALTSGNTVVLLSIGSPIMFVNGLPTVMDTVPEITNGRACLPIAHVVRAFGYTAYWNPFDRSVTIR